MAEAERAKTQEGVKSKNNTKRQQKAASETAMQGSERIPNTAQGKKVTMQHPTQANYLSTSFVAEVERAKTQEGVKIKHTIKREPRAASETTKQGSRRTPNIVQGKTETMLCTKEHLIFLLTQEI